MIRAPGRAFYEAINLIAIKSPALPDFLFLDSAASGGVISVSKISFYWN
jgi:hypothetical protein